MGGIATIFDFEIAARIFEDKLVSLYPGYLLVSGYPSNNQSALDYLYLNPFYYQHEIVSYYAFNLRMMYNLHKELGFERLHPEMFEKFKDYHTQAYEGGIKFDLIMNEFESWIVVVNEGDEIESSVGGKLYIDEETLKFENTF